MQALYIMYLIALFVDEKPFALTKIEQGEHYFVVLVLFNDLKVAGVFQEL